jgi:hypothetical protein
MTQAHRLLALEIASVPEQQKRALQQGLLREAVQAAGRWS